MWSFYFARFSLGASEMRRLFVDDVIPPNPQRPLRPFTAHCQAAGTPVGICKSETVKWWNAPSRMAVIHCPIKGKNMAPERRRFDVNESLKVVATRSVEGTLNVSVS